MQLKANAVTTGKVLNGTLLGADFKASQVPFGKIGPAGPAGPAGAAGAAGPAGPSDANARFLNGPVAIPAALTTIANLTIPQAGRYVLWAKVTLSATASGNVTCRLNAGTNFDQSQSYTFGTANSTLTTIVVNEYAAAGSADFQCQANTGTLAANLIKIAAIRVANLTNSG